jgi:hypothetical protein
MVTAYGSISSSYTDASGSYTITELEHGKYTVYASKTGYKAEYYDNKYSSNLADRVYVNPGIGAPVDTPNINFALSPDSDGDGIVDSVDNCPAVSNVNQTDTDGDGIGDACVNCPFTSNSGQEDSDGNGLGDACTVTHCVSNSAELQNSLTTAQANSRNDIIQLVQGTYRISENNNSSFRYSSSEPYSIIIKGGYSSGCASRECKSSQYASLTERIFTRIFAGVISLLGKFFSFSRNLD